MMRWLSRVVVASSLFLACSVHAAEPVAGEAARFAGLTGGEVRLGTLRGAAVLVVNTASRCGYTGQYAGLEALWRRMRSRGLVVIGVPSNDFGGQEPGTAQQIAAFCTDNFGVTFPMTARSQVAGTARHPFYAWSQQSLGDAGVPKWNFHKILVSRRGFAVAAFPSSVEPDDPALLKAIEDALQPN